MQVVKPLMMDNGIKINLRDSNINYIKLIEVHYTMKNLLNMIINPLITKILIKSKSIGLNMKDNSKMIAKKVIFSFLNNKGFGILYLTNGEKYVG